MTDIRRAIEDISTIRNQIAASQLFCGFGPLVVGMTGGLAIIAAFWQIQHPRTDYGSYLAAWLAVAVIALALIGAEMFALSKRHHAGMARAFIWMMLEKFLPVGLAGASICIVLFQYAPDVLWMLPGLWQILIALGLFSAASSLPVAVQLAAGWYFLAGLTTMILASSGGPLSPWLMGVPFGVGQILVALCLHFSARGQK